MRLRFSKEELENESVFRAAKRAERAADKADEVKARLPVRNKLQSEKKRVSGYRDKLRFGKQDISVELETRPRGEKKAGKSGTSKGWQASSRMTTSPTPAGCWRNISNKE